MLWQTRKDGRWVECVSRVVPTGVQVKIISDGILMYSRIFSTSEEALAWAEEERQQRQ